MTKSAVVTARLNPDISAELDKLAEAQDRSRSWLIAQAIERYVRGEIEFLAFVEKGEDAIERGDYLTQEQMEDWVAARATTADAA